MRLSSRSSDARNKRLVLVARRGAVNDGRARRARHVPNDLDGRQRRTKAVPSRTPQPLLFHSGCETPKLVGVKRRGIATTFRHTRKKKTLSCARWLCLLYLRRCAARWLRPVGTPSHRVQNSGGSVGLGLAPLKVRAVCERGKGGGGLEASGSFRPVSQRDKRMIGRSVSTFPDRSNERRKAVRTVQESRYRSLAFSH